MPRLPELVPCPTCGCWITIDLAARVEDEERPEVCPKILIKEKK